MLKFHLSFLLSFLSRLPATGNASQSTVFPHKDCHGAHSTVSSKPRKIRIEVLTNCLLVNLQKLLQLNSGQEGGFYLVGVMVFLCRSAALHATIGFFCQQPTACNYQFVAGFVAQLFLKSVLPTVANSLA